MMPWWMWFVVGVVLLVLEVLTPGGFFAFFFGVSGLLVGVLAVLHVVDLLWVQVLIFSGLAILTLLLFRNRLIQLLAAHQPKTPPMADIKGEIAILAEDLEVGATGKAELRGVRWNVTNADTNKLVSGQRCIVIRVEGLMLFLKAE